LSQLPSFGYFFGKKKLELILFPNHQQPQSRQVVVKGFNGFIAFADKMAPLGNASALDCANYTVAMFSDLTKCLKILHDGGFSNMGSESEVMKMFE
jgi:enoyl-[acyl-carrier protein] reductase I